MELVGTNVSITCEIQYALKEMKRTFIGFVDIHNGYEHYNLFRVISLTLIFNRLHDKIKSEKMVDLRVFSCMSLCIRLQLRGVSSSMMRLVRILQS